jgi:hypothetical protein
MVKFMQKFAETQTKCSGETIKMGYMAGGKPIPADLPEAEVEGEGLTKQGKNTMENSDYKKDMDEIKVRLSALEEAMKPKDEEKKEEVKAEEAPKVVIEKEDEKEDETKEMSTIVKKVLTEFGIKPVPASPVIEEAPKKDEPKNFEALVSAHPEYKNSKLNAMKAVMLSNPNEYREALSRGIKNI